MVSTIFDPREPKSELDFLIIGMMALHVFLFYMTAGSLRKGLFLVLFAFWRASYNIGIGLILHNQSKHNMLVNMANKYSLFDSTTNSRTYRFVKRQLTDKMGKDYVFDASPIEYQTWLLFRRVVDLVLMLDFCSYVLLALSWSHTPTSQGAFSHVLRWTVGIALILFNLWIKLDANRVIPLAWHWADFFYLVDSDLTFDGVYELCMHPMYSLGYVGYYGISMLACSYAVLFTSIIAHISQFVFLYAVEEPHINKIYNPKHPIHVKTRSEQVKDLMSTELAFGSAAPPFVAQDEKDFINIKLAKKITIFRPFDPHRVVDLTQTLIVIFCILFATLTPQEGSYRTFSVVQSMAWRLVHFLGLMYTLNGQSDNKLWTKHFLKFGDSPKKAWQEWKSIYALSLTMTHATFLIAAWKSYAIPYDWQYGTVTLRHVLGVALIGMHIWTSISIYNVLGDFGWHFGDFFVDEKVPKLKYTGVYRYLNNPERVVYSSWGVALISNSKAVLMLAAQAQILNLLFIHLIEKPHMDKLYGEQVRKEAGFTRSLKSMPVVDHPQIRKKVEEIEGTFDRVFDMTINSVQDFLQQARPHFYKAVENSKIIVSRYQSSVTITRVAGDLSDFDLNEYALDMEKSSSNIYSLGEPIRVRWRAPVSHGKRDWIGIYRITDNLSKDITRVSSKSRWSAIHADGFADHNSDIVLEEKTTGTVELRGDTLPWTTGSYELRYHHDGKHNVMAISPPFEIAVHKSEERNYYKVEQDLLQLIDSILESERGVLGPRLPDDEIVFADDAEKYARRIAYGIHECYDIDFAWQLIACDASVRNITARIARSRKLLAPFVRYQPPDVEKDSQVEATPFL